MKHELDDGSEILVPSFDEEGNVIKDERTNIITKVPLDEEKRYTFFESRAKAKREEYKFLRANEYPDFKEYLDGIVKGDQSQIDAYIAACQAVKDKYPKPE